MTPDGDDELFEQVDLSPREAALGVLSAIRAAGHGNPMAVQHKPRLHLVPQPRRYSTWRHYVQEAAAA